MKKKIDTKTRHQFVRFGLVIAALLLVLSCAIPSYSRNPLEAMRQIRQQGYIVNVHDCSDMAMEYRDYLHWIQNFPYTWMRLVTGEKVGTGQWHMWLEVRFTNGWRIFDPSAGVFSRPASRDGWYTDFRSTYLPGQAVLRELGDNCYEAQGDRFNDGKWFSATEVREQTGNSAWGVD